MTRTRIALVIGLAAAALVVAGCGGDDDSASDTTEHRPTTTETTTASGSTLTASVGPGFDISLKTPKERMSRRSRPGVHVEVDDQSDIHNFPSRVPALTSDRASRETGMSTWT